MRLALALLLVMMLVSGVYAAVHIDLDSNYATFYNQYGNMTVEPFTLWYSGSVPGQMEYTITFEANQSFTIEKFCGIYDNTVKASESDALIWKDSMVKNVSYSYDCQSESWGSLGGGTFWCYQNGTNDTIYTTSEREVVFHDPGPGGIIYWNDTTQIPGWKSLKDKFSHEEIEGRHHYCANGTLAFSPGEEHTVKWRFTPREEDVSGKWDWYIETDVGTFLIDPTWTPSSRYEYAFQNSSIGRRLFTKISAGAGTTTELHIYDSCDAEYASPEDTFPLYKDFEDNTNQSALPQAAGTQFDPDANGFNSSYSLEYIQDGSSVYWTEYVPANVTLEFAWYRGNSGRIGTELHNSGDNAYWFAADLTSHLEIRRTADFFSESYSEIADVGISISNNQWYPVNITTWENKTVGVCIDGTCNTHDDSAAGYVGPWRVGFRSGGVNSHYHDTLWAYDRFPDDFVNISYGARETDTYVINGTTCSGHIPVNITTKNALSNAAIEIDTTNVTGESLYLTNDTGGGSPSDPYTNVSACGALSAGTRYRLTQDITNTSASTCFYASGSNVELDLYGHTVSGDGSNNMWLETGGDDNLTIHNGTIEFFNYGVYIHTELSEDVVIENLIINDSTTDALALLYADGAVIDNITIDRGNIRLTSLDVNISNVDIVTPEDDGIELLTYAQNADIENVTITDCAGYSGIYATNDSHTLTNITINTCEVGINVTDGATITGSDFHLYNNEYDVYVEYDSESTDIDFDNIVFDRPAGDLNSFTNLSIDDTLGSGEEYYLNYTTEPTTPPNDKNSLGFWVEITKVASTPTIGELVWHYTDADVVAAQVGESSLDMYEYVAAWSELTDSLDTGANTLTVTNLVTHSDYGPLGDPDFKVNATVPNANETENKTLNYSLISSTGDITAYNVTFYYNNTLMKNLSVTGVSAAAVHLNFSAVAPLVATNLSNIPWNVTANVTIGGSPYSDTDEGNQTVQLWYYPDAYPITADANYTVEGRNNFSVTIPSKPTSAPEDVAYSRALSFPNCTRVFANTTEANATCGNTFVNDFMQNFSVLPAHTKGDGLIYSDVWVNRSYTLSFDATAESESSKTISALDNATREYFVWLVNSSNGSIDGADNISSVFNMTFYDEETLAQMNITSAVLSFTVTFPDDATKTYSIGYSGNFEESIIRGYPDWYTAEVTSVEVYSKPNYTTRSRFMTSASTPLNEQQNVSLYLLPDAEATYAIINVVDNGVAVTGATVYIQKFYASTSLYLNVEQKVTNSDGQAAAFLDVDAYYKFTVYDSSGDLAYTSTSPEQFIYDGTNWELTINIADPSALDFTKPYPTGTCYGNLTSNSIVFSYSDYTGKTTSVNFLAYRSNGTSTTPVCNQTISAASGGWVCTLPAGENLSLYAYGCKAVYTASPARDAYSVLIDLVIGAVIADWPIVLIMMGIGLGAAGLHPIVGLITLTIGFVGAHVFGIAPINQTWAVYMALIVGVTIFLMAKGDES